MDNLKEKLVELLYTAKELTDKRCDSYPNCDGCPADNKRIACMDWLKADCLLSLGVTVQEWIPASEPPKEPGEYIVAQKHWSDGHLETKKGKWNGVEWLVDGRESLRVAYWMPLSEPPKGG